MTYRCGECGEEFPTRIEMLEHLRSAHPMPSAEERLMDAIFGPGFAAERKERERMEATEEHADVTPGADVRDWLSGISGSPGIVVDPGKARTTACIRLELGEERKPLVYSPGIIGALDEEQIALYCAEGFEERQLTPDQQERRSALQEAAHACSVLAKESPRDEHISVYFSCLGEELKQKGLEP